MSAHEITVFQVKCDCCGCIETNYGEHSSMESYSDARDALSWGGEWSQIDDKDYCPRCALWSEDDAVEPNVEFCRASNHNWKEPTDG